MIYISQIIMQSKLQKEEKLEDDKKVDFTIIWSNCYKNQIKIFSNVYWGYQKDYLRFLLVFIETFFVIHLILIKMQDS